MYKVGITGGIGTGKSTVCRIFSLLGIPVYDADTRAKWLTENHTGIRESLIAVFGSEVFQGSVLNRTYLSSIAFKDASATTALNNIIHPIVGEDFCQWTLEQKDVPYVLKEAALLYEAGTARDMDTMIVVAAPREIRIKRVLSRDPYRTEKQIHDIMDRQWSDEKKQALADHILYNDEQQLLIPQVLHLHEQFIKQALS
jgi:dephospho-CoA kinase